jgi:hypothetical protein
LTDEIKSSLGDATPAAYPAASVFVEEALRYANDASAKKIPLRIIGGMAIYLHSENQRTLWNSLARLGDKVFTDIDYVSLSAQLGKIVPFFEEMGYTTSRSFLYLHGNSRAIFYGKTIPMIDIFMDKLDFCHTIDLRKRLDVDYPTISLADLLLEKLQIVQLNEKDVKDTIVMLRAHNVGDNDQDTVNIDYVSRLLSDDWGFYHTFTTNLSKIKEYINQSQALVKDRDDLFGKIDKISQRIESEPKSTRWKMRAKVGTRRKWYQDVGDVGR